jgi:hypothetical protein
MSEIKVNKISPRTACGTTTLGDSGDTFTIPSGVSITNQGTASGFGSTGEVSWVTTTKTTTFTVTAGEGYFCDTSSGGFTVNLPAGTAGASFAVADYTNTFQTGNLTISPNGTNKIGGVAADAVLTTEGQSAYFVYVDDTEGWKNVIDSTSNILGQTFITATGGTEITCGNFKIHKFTGPGTFTVNSLSGLSANNKVDYVIVAGGGGGGNGKAGGGGAGGYRETPGSQTCYTASPLGTSPAAAVVVTAQGYPVAVGAGGNGSPQPNSPGSAPKGSDGSVSTIFSISSAGGGGGGSVDPSNKNGNPGGSGGGGSQFGGAGTGGTGNSPPVNPAQGTNGGNGFEPGAGGGGGGAGGAGANAQPQPSQASGGNGGDGVGTEIIAQPNPAAPGIGAPGPVAAKRFFSGGGGAGAAASPGSGPPGTGGFGGGGTGEDTTPRGGPKCGVANTGGGGGATSGPTGGPHTIAGGNGGSGVILIRYKFQ